MKTLIFGYCVLCIFFVKVQSKPQITKLFPVEELAAYHEQTNGVKPLDKFLGKLRATYNFVFHKPEDTSNVEKILARDTSDPKIEALKQFWINVASSNGQIGNKHERNNDKTVNETRKDESSPSSNQKIDMKNVTTPNISNDDWLDDIKAPKPLDQLELQDDFDNDDAVETITPRSTLYLPASIGRHLLEWLGSLLGLTYGAYTNVAKAIKNT